MKIKKILSLVLALALVLSAAQLHTHALDFCEDDHCDCEQPAEEVVETDDVEQAVSSGSINDFVISGGIEYQIPEEYRRECYQLTEDELNLPTAELIDLILEHNMLIDISVSSFANRSAYDTMRNNYNALVELESRPDAVAAIIAKFAEILSQPAQWDALSELSNLRELLYEPTYWENISESLMAVLQVLLERFEDYCKSEVFNTLPDGWSDVSSLLSEESAYSTAATLPNSFTLNGFVYNKSSEVVKTKGGKNVVPYSVEEDRPVTEQSSKAKEIAEQYQIKVLGGATAKYNCFSFAWYSSSSFNSLWIEDIAPYFNDVHTKQVDKEDIAARNIVVYLDALENAHVLHAAIVESVEADGAIICQSKWGQGGLFRHDLGNVPDIYKAPDGNIYYAVFTIEDHSDYQPSSKAPDSVGHYSKCGVCKQDVRLVHNSVFTANNASTHTRECIICGYTSVETHTVDSITVKCKFCKYDLSSEPILPARLQKRKSLAEKVTLFCARAPKRALIRT